MTERSDLTALDLAPVPDLWPPSVVRADAVPSLGGRRAHRRRPWILIAAVLVVVVGLVSISALGGDGRITLTVPSISMEPTLLAGGAVEVDLEAYAEELPARGDVVAFRDPSAPEFVFFKRVIGLPGDVVEERQGRLSVNGDPLDEPYAVPGDGSGRWVVPAGEVFVAGDNRPASLDSRNGLGTVGFEELMGEVLVDADPVDDPRPPPPPAVVELPEG